jgi:hypothetical protein
VQEESLVDIAIAWTMLGLIFGVFLLVKLGAFESKHNDLIFQEPRVSEQWLWQIDQNESE